MNVLWSLFGIVFWTIFVFNEVVLEITVTIFPDLLEIVNFSKLFIALFISPSISINVIPLSFLYGLFGELSVFWSPAAPIVDDHQHNQDEPYPINRDHSNQ